MDTSVLVLASAITSFRYCFATGCKRFVNDEIGFYCIKNVSGRERVGEHVGCLYHMQAPYVFPTH